ncbi:LysM domain-containing protein [Polyangium sp. 6x1]|uniref:LysM domain-containing protein n=1 Tax=Polyangium sp. 6x1 TaxID=3042689 RepID=UPI002482DC8D|nr:LysM domain-containing protein [Polyangium sp. 6x1]MDI1445939.1 LysM domain-containing protein [Polyangium sp. 6x1]
MRAITLSYDTGAPFDEQGNPLGEASPIEDTGDFMQMLSGLFGGGGGGGGAPNASSGGGSLGESLGMLAGAGLGSLIGPAGTAIGASIGRAGGGLIEGAVKTATAPRKRKLTKHERKILAEGQEKTRRTGNPVYADEANLRVHRPADYRRRRAAGTLPSQRMAEEQRPPTQPPPAQSKTPRIRFDFSGAAHEPSEEQRVFAPEYYERPHEDRYDDTAAVDTRPRPLRHTSIAPLSPAYMESLMRDVPAVKNIDPRLLRLASGNVSVARDVSGVDPTTGTYHAVPGETPHGITKKLTGQVERVQELLAANPGKADSSPVWNIPPGWLLYERETGALSTTRKYVVQSGDSPFAIAKKLGASDRSWWAELRAANPHKSVKNGNWTSLHAGEEIGIPDAWPQHALAVPVNPAAPAPAPSGIPSGAPPSTPTQSQTPSGLPGPGQNATLDPGLLLQVQFMLARWAARNPGACNPADFGRTNYDFTGTTTPRTSLAIQSFQLWWNRERPTRMLRMDGSLDQPTQDALREVEQVYTTPPLLPQIYVPGSTSQYGTPLPSSQQQQPAPTPQPTPNPQPVPTSTLEQPVPGTTIPPGMQIPPGWPYGWPWGWPWLNNQQQQPQQQQPQPVPQPQPQQQPVPQQTSQQPPIPQQQQPVPQQSSQQQQPVPQQQQVPQQQPMPFPFPPFGQWPQIPGFPAIAAPQMNMPAPSPAPSVMGTAQPDSWPLDPHMPEDWKNTARNLLLSMDPNLLEQAAIIYEQRGCPVTANSLRMRATLLRAANPGPEYEYPVIDTTPDTSTSSSSSSPSLLPVLALIGAGIAFS